MSRNKRIGSSYQIYHSEAMLQTTLDKEIGGKLRLFRTVKGLTQVTLGDRLRVTFQQIQKYESGKDRIASSTLYECSKILGVPIQKFFEEVDKYSVAREILPLKGLAKGLIIIKKIEAIKSPKLRRNLKALINSLE